jgi:hypothetical protein
VPQSNRGECIFESTLRIGTQSWIRVARSDMKNRFATISALSDISGMSAVRPHFIDYKDGQSRALPVRSNPSHDKQYDEDDNDDTDDTDAAVTVAVAVATEAATEATK